MRPFYTNQERSRWRRRFVDAPLSKRASGADTRKRLTSAASARSALQTEPPPPPPNEISGKGKASEPAADHGTSNAAGERDRIASPVPKVVSVSDTTVRQVFDRIHALAPATSPRPWATREALAEVRRVLEDGATPAEVIDLARGAAEVISDGGQDPKWYTVRNLLRERTRTRWLADIAELRAKRRRAKLGVGEQLELVPDDPDGRMQETAAALLRRIRGGS